MDARVSKAQMQPEQQSHVAFHMTGKRIGDGLDAVESLGLRPALLAGYRDLARLRYDFPLVLVENAPDQACLQSLSAVLDGVWQNVAWAEGERERARKHLLRLEREIRAMMADSATGSLSALWDEAAGRIAARTEEPPADTLVRSRAALQCDGALLDCDKELPVRVFRHAWAAVQEKKTGKFREDARRLIQKLSDILRADFVRSGEGRSAESLKASFGGAHRDAIDFEVMSRILAKSTPKATISEPRRKRIGWALSVLQSQRFFPAAGERRERKAAEKPYAFAFDSCASALEAFRDRLPRMIELAKAITVAELEVEGQYLESRHDPLLADVGESALAPGDLSSFPDYLVCVESEDMKAGENAKLMAALGAGLPLKILIQADDILGAAPIGESPAGYDVRSKPLASMAIGLNDVYVLQCASSNLVQAGKRIAKGLAYPGPAMFSVFSGAGGETGDIPAYLVAAAAVQARAFPAFAYDPSAGADLASRFCLDDNPQPERDWPVQGFQYEDEEHQRTSEQVAFTFVDFVAFDRRFARHLARIARRHWDESMIPAGDFLGGEAKSLTDKVPYVLMVDGENVLQKVIVDEKLVLEARRCTEAWHSLQDLAGMHAAKLLAREKAAWEDERQRETERRASEAKSAPAIQVPPAPTGAAPAAATAASQAAAAVPAAAQAEAAKSSDEPYIETPRCSTCNECTQINDRMFGYDENKQARIINLDAGTYRQLVEAAESCQVSIIHPGKPRNPNEPGLEELIKRAEPFL